MRTMILAGGTGSRLHEATSDRPKPMVEIGGKPIVWHIMKHYAFHGFNDFVIALGHLGEVIKEYFLNSFRMGGDIAIDFARNQIQRDEPDREDWLVQMIDTGAQTHTGGRLKRLEHFLDRETFMVTYGDGVSDINLEHLVAFHKSHGKLATVTAVRPPSRFGSLVLEGDTVRHFVEKPIAGEGWINGGFFVLDPEVFDLLHGDFCSLESDLLQQLSACGQLCAYRHVRFWQCMDTLRDKRFLEELWQQGHAPWRTWKESGASPDEFPGHSNRRWTA